MPGSTLSDDPYLGGQALTYEVSMLEDCALAVDATHFIQLLLDSAPSHEPLMCALAGLTGIHMHMENELNQWKAHKVTPLFVFDGQPVVGQDDAAIASGLRDIARTNEAWDLYFGGRARQAVTAFGDIGSSSLPRTLFPLLQRLLKKRKLPFIVAPYNASAQIAYFDMIDSDQCGGIMGSADLLLYPIHDCVIRTIDWKAKRVNAVSKRQIVRHLGVSEAMFIDATLMTGTSFLATFPPLCDASVNPRQPSVADASNMLRTAEKNMATLCASFNDILQAQDPQWLDKFRKARMAVDHFVYIAESGEVRVNDYDKLTSDNHLYLGFQLPAELFHYLNKGLIGPRVLSWITYCQVTVLPTLDGFVSDEYRSLVTKQLVPWYEAALTLVVHRLNRGLNFRNISLKVWFDSKFELRLQHRNEDNAAVDRIALWNPTSDALAALAAHAASPAAQPGSLAYELAALDDKEFVASTRAAPKIKGVASADTLVSLTLWRLLTLRGYVDEKTLAPTRWGTALAATLAALAPVAAKHPDVASASPASPASPSSPSPLHAAALLAWELIRLGLLNTQHQHAELQGFPTNGSEDDKNSVVLISRAATLLQLRQDTTGYTGPLSKNLLAFHSLATTVGDANRALIEALLAFAFMSNQAQRDRDDYWEIGHRLPFVEYPDVALAIAVKTFLDESYQDETAEEKAARRAEFPDKFVPHATHLFEDFDVVFGFVEALCAGVETLASGDLPADDRAAWERAKAYLARRK